MKIEAIRNATNRRVVSAWGRGSHAFAETVKPGAPATPAIYLDDEWLELLESHDGGTTWAIADPGAFPLLDV